MYLEKWFPTPIFYSFASDEIKNAIASEYFTAEKLILDDVKDLSFNNISTSYFKDRNLIDKYSLINLKNFIINTNNAFSSVLFKNKQNYLLNESWVNYSKQYQHHEKHHHLPHRISGVYYIKTNEQDGNLLFYPPSIAMDIEQEPSEISSRLVSYAPKEGKIILFPSWVEHSVQSNITNSTRISISFNIL
jgi:uncharacterized protein (TIGR02466 family)